MKALARIGVLILVIMAAAAIASVVFLNSSTALSSDATSSDNGTRALSAVFLMLGLFMAFVPYVGIFALFIVVLRRFYKNLYTDEGYLTLTLPVKISHIISAHFLAGLIWLVAAVAIALISTTFSLSSSIFSFLGGSALDLLRTMLAGLGGSLSSASTGSIVLGILSLLVSSCYSLSIAYCAITLGALVSLRHKVACAVGFYLLFSWGISLTLGAFNIMGAYMLSVVSSNTINAYLSGTAISTIVVHLIVAISAFFVSNYLLNRKVDIV